MKKHMIELNNFLQKGQVTCEYRDNMLFMTTNRSIPTQRFDLEHLSINSYMYLPIKYKLPLRIDLTVKIDAPGLYILLGKGHINFGTLWADNRRMDDIAAPTKKPMNFHNHIKMNEFTEISLIYDLKEMQILVNGEERYYSKNEKYMKLPTFREMNTEGFDIKLACDKMVNLCIKSFSVTEHDDTCNIIRSGEELPAAITKNMSLDLGEKPNFEKCITLLPVDIQSEIIKIDEYLRTIKPLKFKRQLEKNGNKISYVASEYGVSYAIYLSNDIFDHSLQWYIITNGKPDTWHRKADRMKDTLTCLDNKSHDFAERMFHNLDECVGCYRQCLARTRYQFLEKSKAVCHGKLKFKMSPSGFDDVRTFIDEINHLVQDGE